MIKWLKDLFAAKRQLAELQKAHDARLMLNRRLSQQNADLKSELHKGKKPKGEKPVSSAAQKHIDDMSYQYSKQKAIHHIALMRREVQIRKLALLVPFDQVVRVQAEVDSMSDVQVLAYKKPKLQIATSISN
jgi:hypothetical protein